MNRGELPGIKAALAMHLYRRKINLMDQLYCANAYIDYPTVLPQVMPNFKHIFASADYISEMMVYNLLEYFRHSKNPIGALVSLLPCEPMAREFHTVLLDRDESTLFLGAFLQNRHTTPGDLETLIELGWNTEDHFTSLFEAITALIHQPLGSGGGFSVEHTALSHQRVWDKNWKDSLDWALQKTWDR